MGIRVTVWWAAQNYLGINSFSLGPTSGNTSNNYDNDWQTFWCLWFWHSVPLHCWIVSYKDQKYSNRHLLHYRQSHTSQVRKVEKISEDSLDSIPSPSFSVTIQIIGRKVYFGKFQKFVKKPSNVFTPKLYTPSTPDLILWHTHWIVCAVKLITHDLIHDFHFTF